MSNDRKASDHVCHKCRKYMYLVETSYGVTELSQTWMCPECKTLVFMGYKLIGTTEAKDHE